MRRGSSTTDLKKKRKDLFSRPDTAVGRTKKSNSNGKGKTGGISTKTKQGKDRTPAQMAAAKRLAQKKAGTYKKPMTAQERAKARLKIKKKK